MTDEATIQEDHDEQNPFSVIPNALLRDESISPECRWLISYLLSNAKGWTIKVAQIIRHVAPHMGRNKVYKVINEALESGYMRRENYLVNNLKRTRYYIASTPRFKKYSRSPNNHTPDSEHGKETTKEEISNVIVSVTPPPEAAPPVPSAAPPVEKKIEKNHTNGTKFLVDKSDLRTMAKNNRLDWTQDEIDRLFTTVEKYPKPISNLFRFCSGTVNNWRIRTITNEFKAKSCKTKQDILSRQKSLNLKRYTPPPPTPIGNNISETKPDNSNSDTSELVSLKQMLDQANFYPRYAPRFPNS